jgi:hypothetical protein
MTLLGILISHCWNGGRKKRIFETPLISPMRIKKQKFGDEIFYDMKFNFKHSKNRLGESINFQFHFDKSDLLEKFLNYYCIREDYSLSI